METQELIKKKADLEIELKKVNDDIEDAKNKNNIMNRVKSYEDACKVLGVEPISESLGLEGHVLAYMKLVTIAKALNEGWEPNWDNTNEYKYYPYFRVGVSFFFNVYCSHAADCVYPSRLSFKSSQLAVYAGMTFIDIYKEYLLIKK